MGSRESREAYEAVPGNLADLISYRKLYDVVKFSVELDVYARLEAPATPAELSDTLGLDAVFVRYLLNVLAGAGYVEKDEAGRYKNTPVSGLYLNRKSPSFIGDEVFGSIETYGALRKYADEGPGANDITKEYWSPGLLNNIGAFALLGHVQSAVESVDLSGRKSMLDIGGGHGLFSIFFTKKYPGMRSRVYDLPGVLDSARENIKKYRAGDSVSVVAGDFNDLRPGGTYDAVFISNVTASYGELCRLLENAKGLMSRGGMLVLRNYANDLEGDDWSSLVVLDRYSRRGNPGFSTAQLRAAMESCGLADVRRLYEGDGIVIYSGINLV